ncbi:ABC transporter ATP-binding protein [Pseudoruegeria sp. SHC-113]|uniref:ABC transporter ATP-binding protein n=1 Tax=Pseudoruegeria sp. SHC-113 TaxID=2855439 RepID=UPI0021BB8A5C|nr:ABC transporter ATP-binding protein [Pseudoruegeria sp. SHC-113]MCT8158681.1 ABC transporter ATP-binding protein [Pseudoruegeria sp. SHC-113]
MSLLTVENLAVEYPTLSGVVHAVAEVNIAITPGRRVGFVGESGSGKTTTALAVMRMIKAPGRIARGKIMLGETDLLSLGAEEMRQARLSRVSYIPQGAMNSLNPVMRIEKQIWDGIVDHEGPRPKSELQARSKAALEGVGLKPEVGRMYPHELSGGMKQRACIAIGTALNPELIIADEPTSALDVITQRQVMETLRRAQESLGSALILIGHDMGLMAQSVDELVVMKNGHIVEQGEIAQIMTAPAHPYTKQLIASVPMIGGESFLPAAAKTPEKAPAQHSGTEALLTLDNVSKTYGGGLFGGPANQALAPVSMRLDGGRPMIVSVVGQSGSGKSTLGGLMLGFTPPSTGAVTFEGQDVASLPRNRRKDFRRDVQAVFQDPYGSFNPFYRVDRALTLPLKRFGITSDHAEIEARMAQACEAVGLDPNLILGRFAHELSGGQRQRLMVARALMLSPKLLIADEPVSMVDASLRASILKNLHALKEQFGISIVYITHDLATAYHVSDYVIVLHHGRVAEAGPPAEVIGDPQHPYTRLLIGSIPWPDITRRWGGEGGSAEDLKALAAMAESRETCLRGKVEGFDLSVPG